MGTTILGDGNLAAILDPEGMIKNADLTLSNVGKEIQVTREEDRERSVLDDDGRNYLIYETGEGLPIWDVPFLCWKTGTVVNHSECHKRGGAYLFQREDRTLRLIKINDFVLEEKTTEDNLEEAETLYAIIPFGYEQDYAILATRIVDTVDLETEATSYSEKALENNFLEARFALNDELVSCTDIQKIIKSL